MDSASGPPPPPPAADVVSLLRLRCAVQNYEWGRLSEDSTVARLFARNSGIDAKPDRPYAEFWMGTHDSGPSTIAATDPAVSLKQWIREHTTVLGEGVAARWDGDLPFLFKVLSVAKALSIQAHPDKGLAELLHKTRPSVYKDANHKPEMAIAITDFQALCGFVSDEDLKEILQSVPEIHWLISHEDARDSLVDDQHSASNGKFSLQSLFTKLMSASEGTVSEALRKLKTRLNKKNVLTEKEKLVLQLEKQYPEDIGVLSAFFFNYVKLSPGEALYIAANEPHAYLTGECVECMATSDNVVRAGLTPKYRDVETLCSMLTYKQGFPEILNGNPLNSHVSRYTPPFDEFEVDRCLLPAPQSAVFPSVGGPSIFVVMRGNGSVRIHASVEETQEGDVFFVPANQEIELTAASLDSLLVFRAGINTRFLGKM